MWLRKWVVLPSRLQTGLKEYAEYVCARQEDSEALKVQDPRSEEEKMAAADLLSSVFVEDKPADVLQQAEGKTED